MTRQLPTQCTDNEDEYPGAVVYDDEEFPISSQQDGQDVEMTASGERQGNHRLGTSKQGNSDAYRGLQITL